MKKEILRLTNVTKIYNTRSGKITALENVNLSVKEGDFLCVLGPSGSGKTTLLKVSAGFLKPDSGSVQLFGKHIYQLPLRELLTLRSKLVGFMFQEDLLINTLTVSENVELPLIARGVPRNKRKQLVFQTLERLGISSLADRKPDEISGGERRRVSLAMSIVNQPKILFADEPTSNLDSQTSLKILEELKRINESGTTIIMASHDPLVTKSKHVKRTILLRDGKITNP